MSIKYNGIKVFILIICIGLNSKFSFAQTLIYQDIITGSSTGGGFSLGLNSFNSANCIISLKVDSNSFIKKAFLICNRYENSDTLTIKLNQYYFESNN
jgi:hypothetical protein